MGFEGSPCGLGVVGGLVGFGLMLGFYYVGFCGWVGSGIC